MRSTRRPGVPVPMSKPWTRARLLDEMRRRLNGPAVTLAHARFDPMDCSAACHYERDGRKLDATILVDTAQDGAVTLVLHELLHPLLDEPLEAFLSAELAEFAIKGIEEGMLARLRKNPRQYERWRNAIIRKVEGK